MMNASAFTPLFSVVAAYSLGSISFGILTSRAFGLPDPRTVGSGNPGATNVLRSGKKAAALLTLLGDAVKGWLAVSLALHYAFAGWVICAIALAVFLGHLYPIYYGFKGGKGVATALGVLLAISPWLGLCVLLTWLAAFALWRYSSLAALVAAGLSPVYALLLLQYRGYAAVAAVLALFMFWRHRNNIRKLLNGTEDGFSKSKN